MPMLRNFIILSIGRVIFFWAEPSSKIFVFAHCVAVAAENVAINIRKPIRVACQRLVNP